MVLEFTNYRSAALKFRELDRGILRRTETGWWLIFESVEDARGHPTTETTVKAA